jgi:DNA ligase (NAD+)
MDALRVKLDNDDDEHSIQEYLDDEQMKTLHTLKLYLDQRYAVGDDTIDDWKYDLIKETIQKRDPNYVPPIGVKIKEAENRIDLPYYLGSMNKYKPEDVKDIARWLVDNRAAQYMVSSKLDGVSCLAVFENGRVKLYTRGDGYEGGDITHLAPYIKSVPKNLKTDIAVRGELLIRDAVFHDKHSRKYKNPRNMVAGLTGANTSRDGMLDLVFVAYEIVGDDMEMPKPSKQMKMLKTLGFTVVKHELIDEITLEVLIGLHIKYKTDDIFELDGIIIQADVPYVREMGSNGNPSYAFAFKMRMKDDVVETTILEVDWNISKHGKIIPRIFVEPVELAGATVGKASAFNAKYVVDNQLGPGAVIMITRSGQVIPFIVSVVEPADEPQMTEYDYKWDETRVNIIATNPAQIGSTVCVKIIAGFFEKMGIKHVSKQTVRKMHEQGLDSLLKIIAASEQDFIDIGLGPGISKRSYTNIHNGLQNISLPVVIGASGVLGEGMGRKRVELLFENFPTILEDYRRMSEEELIEKIAGFSGFGDVTARGIVPRINWADKLVNDLSKYATFKSTEKVSSELEGQKYVMSGFRDKDLAEAIVSRGGKVTTSVSKNTTGLIIKNDAARNTSKPQKAAELGVAIYTKDEFIEQFIH